MVRSDLKYPLETNVKCFKNGQTTAGISKYYLCVHTRTYIFIPHSQLGFLLTMLRIKKY
jgi:hypothetical protein